MWPFRISVRPFGDDGRHDAHDHEVDERGAKQKDEVFALWSAGKVKAPPATLMPLDDFDIIAAILERVSGLFEQRDPGLPGVDADEYLLFHGT